MQTIDSLVRAEIDLRRSGRAQTTLLAVCPNSDAVLEAAVRSAARNRSVMLFAATLNQVDIDGGYTGWTPAMLVGRLHELAAKYQWDGPLYACLDHCGPWLKDRHTLDHLSFEATMQAVKDSLSACLKAGYALLHIDPTVDRTLPPGESPALESVVSRTVELILHVEEVRSAHHLPKVSYEVGTEEVHGGLVELDRFRCFLRELKVQLAAVGLGEIWPCFVVAQVGTNLHTTAFDPSAAAKLHEIVSPMRSLIKGHYSDWVENPQDYPATGMGGANVGPEFTSEEYLALSQLEMKERALVVTRPELQPSGMMLALQSAVEQSGRWRKWLQPGEESKALSELPVARREWLYQTGARYIWTDAGVLAARKQLYTNLQPYFTDPHGYVLARIEASIDRYLSDFNLFNSVDLF